MKRSIMLVAAALIAAPVFAGPHNAPAREPDITKHIPDYKLPDLWIGSKAPELTIAEFVKGATVTSFEPGQVYVVEFWATWCQPCIAAFPHLTELQADYKGKVTFVGVNIWERKAGQDRIDDVTEFVEEQGDRMGYTVAIEQGTSMADGWMIAAGRNGIPCAFIVDQTGTIAWVGHPMGMDEPLESIVKGEFDPTEGRKQAERDHRVNAWAQHAMNKLAENEDGADDLVIQLADAKVFEGADMLNRLAWTLLTHPQLAGTHDPLALELARRTCEASDYQIAAVLDTLALAYFKAGDAAKAVETQQKAIDNLGDGEDQSGYRENLKKYQEAAGKS